MFEDPAMVATGTVTTNLGVNPNDVYYQALVQGLTRCNGVELDRLDPTNIMSVRVDVPLQAEPSPWKMIRHDCKSFCFSIV